MANALIELNPMTLSYEGFLNAGDLFIYRGLFMQGKRKIDFSGTGWKGELLSWVRAEMGSDECL